MYDLQKEQKILAVTRGVLLQGKEKGKTEINFKSIEVSPLTIEKANRNLEKACEFHGKLRCKSFQEISEHYSK